MPPKKKTPATKTKTAAKAKAKPAKVKATPSKTKAKRKTARAKPAPAKAPRIEQPAKVQTAILTTSASSDLDRSARQAALARLLRR
ncbi:MAG TPA: hypothetical protein VF331_27820 [Polyangiales bacterium]